MVFYRKYRPQRIEELDSKHVRDSLHSALSHPLSDIPHAFLFTGPKGLGKTSTARIVAKIINCLSKRDLASPGTIEPCNKCESCLSITSGLSMDVLEMDAASNRGIDEVRELKETIKLAPFSSKRKVYIIDEVHMLTTEAFNALLKTLEEPPLHAIFILCTTELHKVPVTILSRCSHISFKLATDEELVRSFKRIAKAEKIDIDDDALMMIASFSDGGFRDGVKILEEVVSKVKKGKILSSDITDQYHTTGSSLVVATICTSIANRDGKMGLTALGNASKVGMDTKYILEQLLSKVHGTILALSGVEGHNMEPALQKLSLSDLIFLSQLLSKAYTETKYAVISLMPLELALLEWASQPTNAGQENVSVKERVMTFPDDVSLSTLRRQVGNIAKQKAVHGEGVVEKKVARSTSGISILNFTSDGDITKEWLSDFWSYLLEKLKAEHHTTAGVLRGCILKSFDRKTLILQTSYKFHKERLDESKTKKVIEDLCKELTGNPVTVTIELKG